MEADEIGPTIDDNTMTGGWVAQTFSIGPMARLLQSASNTARTLAQNLGESAFFTRGMEEGRTAGVSVEAMTEATVGRAITSMEKVRTIGKQAKKEYGMSFDEFDRLVGDALTRGGVSATNGTSDTASGGSDPQHS